MPRRCGPRRCRTGLAPTAACSTFSAGCRGWSSRNMCPGTYSGLRALRRYVTGHRFTGRSGQIVSGLGHITFRARRAIRAGLCRLAILDFGGIPPKRLLVVCKPAVYTNLVDPVRADKVSLSMTTSIQRSLDEGCPPAERNGYVPFFRQTISVMHHDQRPRPHNGEGHVTRTI